MRGKTWLFLLYLIVALYLANIAFSIVNLPDFFTKITKWVIVFAALLILISSFKFLKEESYI